jgi:hypothetical protein
MIEFESYMVPISLPRKKAAVARVRGSGIPRGTHADSMTNLRSIESSCRRLSKSMFTWLSLQRLLNALGHTLEQRKTDYRPKGLQPKSRRFLRSPCARLAGKAGRGEVVRQRRGGRWLRRHSPGKIRIRIRHLMPATKSIHVIKWAKVAF